MRKATSALLVIILLLMTIDVSIAETEIGDYAYEHSEFTTFVIPDDVVGLGTGAFYYCKQLESVTIPRGLRRIGDYAFDHCLSLESVSIPGGVKIIGESAFNYCQSLERVALNNGVTQIGDYAFSACFSLKSIYLPRSVTRIGDYAFFGSRSLERIYIPDTVKSIGESAFEGCKNIVIYTTKNSFVHDYGDKNNIPVRFDISEADFPVMPSRYTMVFESDYWYDSYLVMRAGENVQLRVFDEITGTSRSPSEIAGMSVRLSDTAALKYNSNSRGDSVTAVGEYSYSNIDLILNGECVDSNEILVCYTQYTGNFFFTSMETTQYTRLDLLLEYPFEDGFLLNSQVSLFDMEYCHIGGKNILKFDAYNTSPMVYGVCAYDANGEKIGDAQIINGYMEDFNLWEAPFEFVDGLIDIFSAKFLKGETTFKSKHTEIRITVPDGGYLHFAQMNTDDDVFASYVAECIVCAISIYGEFKNLFSMMKINPADLNKQTLAKMLKAAITSYNLKTLISDATSVEDFTRILRDFIKREDVWGILIESAKGIPGNLLNSIEDVALLGFPPGFWISNITDTFVTSGEMFILFNAGFKMTINGADYTSADIVFMPR